MSTHATAHIAAHRVSTSAVIASTAAPATPLPDGWIPLSGLSPTPPPVTSDGWVPLAELAALDEVRAVTADLESRRDALAIEIAELDAIRANAAEEARATALAQASGELRTALERLATAQQRIAASASDALALVARDVVASLLRQALTTDHDALARWIADTLASRPGTGALRLRVHPDHVATLAPASPCPVQPDPRLAPGDAIIELPDGQLDLRLDHLAAALAPTVQAALGHLPTAANPHRPDTSLDTSLDDLLSRTVCTDPTPPDAPEAP